MIDKATVARIMDAARIEEVVADYVSLRKRGVNLIGLCPFHNEKTGSFIVSPAKGIFKCFGCSEAGSAVHFIMKIEQKSYPEALKQLAKKYNIEPECSMTLEEIRNSMVIPDGQFDPDFLTFQPPLRAMQTAEGLSRITEELVEQLEKDGVVPIFENFVP